MDWSQRMNAVVSYIEENLDAEIDINKAAEIACCSSHHFQHMFFAIIGVTVAEYTRRRRLTMAAKELMTTDALVIDVALKYGYDSPNSFTRSFRNLHGINPGSARGSGIKLAAYPRVSFYIELKGGSEMLNYKIVEKPSFEVLGRSKKFTTINDEHEITIPKYNEEFHSSQEAQELWKLIDMNQGLVTGAPYITISFALDNNKWEHILYAICIEKSKKTDPNGFEVFQIPSATWAIFDCNEDNIKDVRKRVYSEWWPSTGYEHDEKPEIIPIFYDIVNQRVDRIELWYPVIKNN
jgi:AraC family transcriptional regulator